jgi:hypothetical protein
MTFFLIVCAWILSTDTAYPLNPIHTTYPLGPIYTTYPLDHIYHQGRFGGGIVSLKLLYPLLDAHKMSDLGLKMQLHTDKPPSFGYCTSK